jgi:MFS family permease
VLSKEVDMANKFAATVLTMTAAQGTQLSKHMAIVAVATMIGVMFAGSTLLTPLYIIYKQRFGFSDITLTLIYAAYIVGNLGALLVFGRLSDQIGRRRAAMPALAVAVLSTLVFLFTDGTAALFWARALSGLGIGVAAGTGNAWLAELVGLDKARATIISTGTNFLGLAFGPLIAGLLAQYAPWPLHLSFVVYLAAVVVVAALIWRTKETVTRPVHDFSKISLSPRIGVPRTIRVKFVAPAVAGFGAMALFGFFAALAPSILSQELHETSHARQRGVRTRHCLRCDGGDGARLSSRAAMLWGLGLMVPSVLLLVTAQMLASIPVMVCATALCGVSAGLGYRGSLQVVNQIAPENCRAEVISSYFVCCFIGNALGHRRRRHRLADALRRHNFRGMIVLFAFVALIFGVKYTR